MVYYQRRIVLQWQTDKEVAMLKVGTVVRLKVVYLGNQAGTKGVCYETYNLGWGPRASIIFKNGEYDDFSLDEQENFLEVIEDTNFSYNFQNVMTLFRDFDKGVFNEVLGIDPTKQIYS